MITEVEAQGIIKQLVDAGTKEVTNDLQELLRETRLLLSRVLKTVQIV